MSGRFEVAVSCQRVARVGRLLVERFAGRVRGRFRQIVANEPGGTMRSVRVKRLAGIRRPEPQAAARVGGDQLETLIAIKVRSDDAYQRLRASDDTRGAGPRQPDPNVGGLGAIVSDDISDAVAVEIDEERRLRCADAGKEQNGACPYDPKNAADGWHNREHSREAQAPPL